MRASVKTWALRLIKIAIAIVGLWVVVWAPWKDEPALVWRDRGTLRAGVTLRGVAFRDPVPVWIIEDRGARVPGTVAVAVVTFSDRPIYVLVDGQEKQWLLSGTELRQALAPMGFIGRIEPDTGFSLFRWARSFQSPHPQIVIPEADLLQTDAKAGEKSTILRQVGLYRLLREANPWLLLASWALLVVPFLVSAWRWRKLMEPQGIRLPFSKCLALTFVGQFYSTFLPGITGGDLVKIIYTARVVGSKTKATITILLDRVIGLVALMIIGGTAALIQSPGNPTMRNIALLILGILAAMIAGSIAYFSHRLRRLTGLQWLLERKFIPDFVRKADDVLHVYRGHIGVLFQAVLISLITQIVVPLSAWLAGCAFGMNLHPGYYLAYVPPALLAASIPIFPPQGLGVLDSILQHFFVSRGTATGEQAFALAQAIRFLPLVWNFLGAYWVVTGTYSRQQAVKEDAQTKLA